MKIGTRLAASFALVLGLMVVVGAVSIFRLDMLKRKFDTTLSHDLLVVAIAADIESHARAGALKTAELFVRRDSVGVLAEIESGRKIIAASLDTLSRQVDSDEARALEAKMEAAYQAYGSFAARIPRLLAEKDRAAAEKLFPDEMLPALDVFITSLRLLAKHYVGAMDEAGAAAAAEYGRARAVILSLLAVAVLAGAALAWIITRGLMRRLGGEPDYAAQVASRIAAGDLATRVETRAGDASSLLAAMRHMQETLSDVIERIVAASGSLKGVARDTAAANTDLSRRTEAQAASLDETASSMEELAATVGENADNAKRGSELTRSSAATAQKGEEAVQRIVATMESIRESSNRVGEIISVIDGIAFQTNILALNAAVEAARAHEHGRGFAVVAAEVRALAQRSAAAAREIKTLIGDSVERIGAGAQLVEDAGATIREMVESARHVAEISSQITAASREQAAGIEQVTKSVSQMESGMRQNAALVEETGMFVKTLEEQAEALVETVSIFARRGAPALAVTPAARPALTLAPPIGRGGAAFGGVR